MPPLWYRKRFPADYWGDERMKTTAVQLRRSILLSYHSHMGEWAGLEPATSGSTSEVTAFYNAVRLRFSGATILYYKTTKMSIPNLRVYPNFTLTSMFFHVFQCAFMCNVILNGPVIRHIGAHDCTWKNKKFFSRILNKNSDK